MRLTMAEIKSKGRLDAETKRLYVDEREVGFVYYRTGYQMDHYMVNSQEWDENKW